MKSFAESLLDSLEGKQLDSAYDLFNRANAYAELGRHEEAIADYDRANQLESDYETGMAWYNRGNSLSALGRDEDAVESYERAIAAGTREWAPFVNAALVRVRQQRYDEAVSYYDRYLSLGVDIDEWGCANADALLRKAEVRHLQGDDEAAVALIEQAVSLEDDNLEALGVAADIHALARGSWADAVPLLERMWQIEAAPIPGIKLGIALANVGREDDALAQLRTVIAGDPSLADMLQGEGWRSLLQDPSILDRL